MRRVRPLRFRIGTRGSKLALKQTEQVQTSLKNFFPQADVHIHIIHTAGDKILNQPLSQIGGKGLFTNELEKALMQGEIDLAVHSIKDIPGDISGNFILAAVLPRESPADVFISPKADSLFNLPLEAAVGTSSLRRTAQLKYLRPDIRIVNLRGNVETRLRKMEEQNLDGILLAWAGVKRLGLEEKITQILPFDDMLPAAGQGAIGIETLTDSPLVSAIQELDEPFTHQCIRAERAFLRRLEGDCRVPLAVLAQGNRENFMIQARVIQMEGKQIFETRITGNIQEAEQLGIQAAETLLQQGAAAVLEELQTRGDLKK